MTESPTLAPLIENTKMLSHDVPLDHECLASIAISLKRIADVMASHDRRGWIAPCEGGGDICTKCGAEAGRACRDR